MGSKSIGCARLVAVLAMALIAFSAARSEAAPERPNVILVTVDTVRADHLSIFGSKRRTMPFIERLGAEGVRFNQAQSTSSWTAPAVASLLTSHSPISHGIEHGHMKSFKEPEITSQQALSTRLPLWPELLKRAGYRTFGVTANLHLDGRFGFARGFDEYECVGFADAEEVEKLVTALETKIKSSPHYFLWIHLLDPHARYKPRQPWLGHYFSSHERMPRALYDVIVPQTYKEKLSVEKGSRNFEFVNALYDSELTHADRMLRKMLHSLGVDGDDLIVFTSDHGEEFLDHGRFGHGVTLYEEVTRIPLVMQFPNAEYAKREVDAAVSIVDLLPTVLDYLGLERPSELQGRSLLPLLRGEESQPRNVVSSLARCPALRSDSLRRGRWKYHQRYSEGSKPLLFDLEADPLEQRNLAATHPDRAAELARVLDAELARMRAARVEPSTQHLDAEELEQLRALGYAQ